jgi:pyrroline-5-carboxylate reductase
LPDDLGIVGVGAIAEAIVTGLCEGEDAETSIHLSPRNAERANRLAAGCSSVHVADSNQGVVEQAAVVLVCVRPEDAGAALSDLTFRPDQTVISVMSGIPMGALRALVGPAEIARADPLPAVARRAGLTLVYPQNEVVAAIFNPLGGVMVVEDERAFETLAAGSATLAAHLAYLDAISRWLAGRGIPRADATRYVAAIFGGLSETLLHGEPDDFRALADEFATPGGFNEQFGAALRDAGTFEVVERALDEVADRLERGSG